MLAAVLGAVGLVVVTALALWLLIGRRRAPSERVHSQPRQTQNKSPLPPPAQAPAPPLEDAPGNSPPPLAVRGSNKKSTLVAVFSRSGDFIACSSDDHTVKIMDLHYKTVASLRTPPKTIERLAWSADGRALVGWEGYAREVAVFAFVGGNELRLVDSFPVGGTAGLKAFHVGRTAGGTALCLMFETETVVYDLKTKREIKRIAAEKIRNNDLGVCDGASSVTLVFATWHQDASVVQLHHKEGSWTVERDTLLKGAGDEVLRVDANANVAALSSKDGCVYVFGLAPVVKWKHSGIAFSPDGIAVSGDGSVVAFSRGCDVLLVWRNGQARLHRKVVHGGAIVAMSWGKGNALALTIDASKDFYVWCAE